MLNLMSKRQPTKQKCKAEDRECWILCTDRSQLANTIYSAMCECMQWTMCPPCACLDTFTGGSWTEEALDDFDRLTYCAQWKPLLAKLCSYSHSDMSSWPSVQLYDSSHGKVSDVVKKGSGSWKRVWEIADILFHKVHLSTFIPLCYLSLGFSWNLVVLTLLPLVLAAGCGWGAHPTGARRALPWLGWWRAQGYQREPGFTAKDAGEGKIA